MCCCNVIFEAINEIGAAVTISINCYVFTDLKS